MLGYSLHYEGARNHLVVYVISCRDLLFFSLLVFKLDDYNNL